MSSLLDLCRSSSSVEIIKKICPKCYRALPNRRRTVTRSRRRNLMRRPVRESSKSRSAMPGGVRVSLSRECKRRFEAQKEEFKDDEDEDYIFGDVEDDDDKNDATFSLTMRSRRRRRRPRGHWYRCEICPRVFVSAQGLGSHRVVHRRSSDRTSSEELHVVRSDGRRPGTLITCKNCRGVFCLGDHPYIEIDSSSESDENVATTTKKNRDRFNVKNAQRLFDLNFPLDLNLPG